MFGFVRFCVFVCCILKTALIIIILFVLLWKTVWDASLMRLFWVLFEFHDCVCVVWFHCCFVVVRLAKKKRQRHLFIVSLLCCLFAYLSFAVFVCVYMLCFMFCLCSFMPIVCLYIFVCFSALFVSLSTYHNSLCLFFIVCCCSNPVTLRPEASTALESSSISSLFATAMKTSSLTSPAGDLSAIGMR